MKEPILIPINLKGGQPCTATVSHRRLDSGTVVITVESITDDTTGEDIIDQFSPSEKSNLTLEALTIFNS